MLVLMVDADKPGNAATKRFLVVSLLIYVAIASSVASAAVYSDAGEVRMIIFCYQRLRKRVIFQFFCCFSAYFLSRLFPARPAGLLQRLLV